MSDIAAELVGKAASILGNGHLSEDEIAIELGKLSSDNVLCDRLRNFIPEAFAYAFIPHLPQGTSVVMPKEFSVRNSGGEWRSIPLLSEPIFMLAAQLGMHMYHNGPRAMFKTVISRSAMLDCVNSLLNSGESLAGANMSGLAINGVLADIYSLPESEAPL